MGPFDFLKLAFALRVGRRERGKRYGVEASR
jgi:hypothetical protein